MREGSCFWRREKNLSWKSMRTFLSLFFSAVSSLPALAAWRFSCFAVNYRDKKGGVRDLVFSDFFECKRTVMDNLHTLRLNKLFSRPLMVRVGYRVVGQGRFYGRGSEVPRLAEKEGHNMRKIVRIESRYLFCSVQQCLELVMTP